MSDHFDTTRAPQIGGASVSGDAAPQLGGDAALKHIVVMMQSEDKEIRQQAIDRLEAIGSDRALEMLLEALKDKNRRVRNRALLAIGYLGNRRAFEPLVALLDTHETAEDERYNADDEETKLYQADWPSQIDVLEAIGRLGDARGLPFLAYEVYKELYWEIRNALSFSWSIASIAARNPDPAIQQQAAREFIRIFPWDELSNKYIINRLPWPRSQMLDAVASLLSDPDQEICEYAACFLARFDDARGREVLLAILPNDDFLTKDLEHRKRLALGGLIDIGDRRALNVLIDLLNAPFPPEYAIFELEHALEKCGATLTHSERKRLTATVPYIINHLKIHGPYPFVINGIRKIGTELANDLVDEMIDEEIRRVFAPFIERGDVSKEFPDLRLISLGHNHPKVGFLAHPTMQKYAYPALRARYEYLRAQDPPITDGSLIAYIGWLGDPRALPLLVEELAREEQEVLALREDPEHRYEDGEVGEFIYAISNLRTAESAWILAERLQNPDSLEHWDTKKAMRFYLYDVHDERAEPAVLALLEFILSEAEVDYTNIEVLEAIARTGLPCAVPGLVRLLKRHDAVCSEAINALAEIAKRNPTNAELIDQIVTHLIPMLNVRTWVDMHFFFQPCEQMRIDHFTAIVLKDIGTSHALAAVNQWENGAIHD